MGSCSLCSELTRGDRGDGHEDGCVRAFPSTLGAVGTAGRDDGLRPRGRARLHRAKPPRDRGQQPSRLPRSARGTQRAPFQVAIGPAGGIISRPSPDISGGAMRGSPWVCGSIHMTLVTDRQRAGHVSIGCAVLACLLTLCPGLAAAQADTVGVEAARIVDVLGLTDGSIVADVGAGRGTYTVHLARAVAPSGWTFATEVDTQRLPTIQAALADRSVGRATVILGTQISTGLPPDCSDAILLRRVYHHITEPDAMLASLRAALRPGGRLLVIDFEPRPDTPVSSGVPANRGGHGMPSELLTQEMVAAGFVVMTGAGPWNGSGAGRQEDYHVVFGR